MTASTSTSRAFRGDEADLGDWWASVAELHCEEAGHSPTSAESAASFMEAARIYVEHLAQPGRGAELYRRAHLTSPSDPAPVRELANLSYENGEYADARRWLETSLELESDVRARVAILARLSEILQDHLGEREEARARAREGLDLAPDDRTLLVRLAMLTDPSNSEQQVEYLHRRLEVEPRGQASAALLVEAARLEEVDRGAADRALDVYLQAVKESPNADGSLEGVIRLLSANEDWDALVDCLEANLPRVEDEIRRARLHLVCGTVLARRLDAAGRAAPHLAATAPIAEEPAVIAALADVHERLGEHEQVIAALSRIQPPTASSLYRIGQAYEVGLGEMDAASTAYREALDVRQGYVPALLGLRRCAWRLGEYEAYADALRRQAAVSEGHQRVVLLNHLGDVLECLCGAPDAAAKVFGEALYAWEHAPHSGPRDLPTSLFERARLLRRAQEWGVLESELKDFLSGAVTKEARGQASDWLAELSELHLGKVADAVAYYRIAAESTPENLRAHRALQALLRERREQGELGEAIANELKTAAAYRKLQLLGDRADVEAALGNPKRVEDAWREALEIDPRWLPALRGLGRLFFQHGRWAELVDLLRHELTTREPDDPTRAALLGRVAELCEFRLAMPEEAAQAYLAILELHPTAPDALVGLERLYGEGGRWAELAGVLTRRAESISDPGDRALILLELADLHADHLGQPDRALELYDEAMLLDPTLEYAGWEMERLLLAKGDTEGLAALYTRLSESVRSDEQAAILDHKLAAVSDAEGARGALTKRLGQSPEDVEALWGLIRDAAERQDQGQLSERLERLATLVDTREIKRGLLLEAAEHAKGAGRTVASQERLWRQCVDLEPTSSRAWEGLLSALRQAGDAVGRADALVRLGRMAPNARDRAGALWTAGLLVEGEGRHQDALAYFREAHESSRHDPVPAWLLLDRGAGDEPSERSRLLEALGGRRKNPAGSAAAYTEAGKLYEEQGDPVGALRMFLLAVRRDPTASNAAEAADRLLRARGSFGPLVTLYESRINRIANPAASLEIQRRLAALLHGPLSNHEAARQAYESILDSAPGDVEAHVRLGELCAAEEDYGPAARHLAEAALLSEDDDLLVRIYTQLGRLKAYALSDTQGAIDDLRRAVGLGPHPESLLELAEVYLHDGQGELALMAFQRLHRLADTAEQRDYASAGRVRALLATARDPEALAQVARLVKNGERGALVALARGTAGDESLTESVQRELDTVLAGLPRERRNPPLTATVWELPAAALSDASALAVTGGAAPATVGTAELAPVSGPTSESAPADAVDESAEDELDVTIGDGRAGLNTIGDAAVIAAPDPGSEDVFMEASASSGSIGDGSSGLLDEDDMEAAFGPAPDLDAASPLVNRPTGDADPAAQAMWRRDDAIAESDREIPETDASEHAIGLGATMPSLEPVNLEVTAPVEEALESVAEPSVVDLDLADPENSIDVFPVDALPADGPDASLVPASNAESSEGGNESVGLDDIDVVSVSGSEIAPGEMFDTVGMPQDWNVTSSDDELVEILDMGDSRIQSLADDDFSVLDLSLPDGSLDDEHWSESSVAEDRASVAAIREQTRKTAESSLGARAVELRRQIGDSPLNLEAWRGLRDLFTPADGAYSWLDSVVSWLEARPWSVEIQRPPRRLPKPFRVTLLGSEVPYALLDVLSALYAGLDSPLFVEGSETDTQRDANEPVGSDEEMGQTAQRVAGLLGMPEFELYRSTARPYTVDLIRGNPPRVVLGEVLLDEAEEEERAFLMSSCLLPLVEGTLPLQMTPAGRAFGLAELRALLGAAFAVFDLEYPVRTRDFDLFSELEDRFTESLTVDDVAGLTGKAHTAFAAVVNMPPEELRAVLERYTARLSMALSDSFGGAVALIRRFDFDDRPRDELEQSDLTQLLGESEMVRDLMFFAASPACLAIRSWLGSTGKSEAR